MICLKKASTKSTTIEKAQASCLGTSELLLVLVIGDLDVEEGTGDLHVAVVVIGISCSWAPTSTAAADQAKRKGKIKQG